MVQRIQKYKCVWCGARREPGAERREDESIPEILERQLGPIGCRAPDGDGHLWKEIPFEGSGI